MREQARNLPEQEVVMPADSPSSNVSPHVTRSVRFSRVRRLPRLVTAGATLTVGLGVYALLGQYHQVSSGEAAGAYLLMLILAIPLILTYAERAAALTGSGGTYNLAVSSGRISLAYGSGWLTLGGYVCLIALLGWGVATHLGLLTTQFFGLAFGPGQIGRAHV